MALNKILRTGEGKRLRALQGIVPDVNALEPAMQNLSDAQLAAKTVEFRERLTQGEDLEDLLLEAFAVVREAAVRVLGQRHYDVQLMGGAALHFGWVAEMRTGEGKTLVATLPVYLNALTGRGVHVVTANDYLASRDAVTMGAVYEFLGLTVGLVSPGDNDPESRRAQYAADITHGTNKEFGFDYLRDNMVTSTGMKVQRDHYYVVVDEVDSILIDEARTPLIISGRVENTANMYHKFAAIARGLKRDVHYDVDEKKKQVAPTEEGISAVEKALKVGNLYEEVSQDLVHHFQVALRAKELYQRDRDYVVDRGQVHIVDEFTGRIMEGRRWSDGLHQAVEAKEGVRIQGENRTMASVTLQNYFRMYDKLAGMTGTAQSEASELHGTYGMEVLSIPTHRPMIRVDNKDVVYKDEDSKFAALVEDLEERHRNGQPVLVGTASVEKSEKLANILQKRGIAHEVLNAKQHHREAEIIAQAGRLGAVTISTNMAGRGVDVLLGGNAEMLAEAELRKEITDPANKLRPDDAARLQNRRDELLARYKSECAAEADKVRSLGGLYVLGTERHESRRIDNQLRGRAGRQGDPGESRFYLSLEDDLMRIFGNAKSLTWALDRATSDGEALESKMITKVVEKAQTAIEQANAEVRKNVLKYDDVMNEQRKIIYRRRDQILEGKSLREEVVVALTALVDSLVGEYCQPEDQPEEWDVHALVTEIHSLWPCGVTEADVASLVQADEVYEAFLGDALGLYEAKERELGEDALREAERQVMLMVLDRHWLEHLSAMDYLREGIGWRSAAQKDPLHEWQKDGYAMFEQMMLAVDQEFVTYILHAEKADS
jgi:preprotein translocase subunit SecA